MEFLLHDSFVMEKKYVEDETSELYNTINFFSWSLLSRMSIRFQLNELKEILVWWGRLYYSEILQEKKNLYCGIPVEFQERIKVPLVAIKSKKTPAKSEKEKKENCHIS